MFGEHSRKKGVSRMANSGAWIKDYPAAITVCDVDGKILEMNGTACKMFEKSGGKELIGKNLLDCHPEKAKDKVMGLLKEQLTNCYTIEKDNVKKLVYQAPWYQDKQYMGLVEMVFEIPFEVPHFKR